MSSVARVKKLTLSGLLLYWLCIADQVFVQWLQLQKKHPQACYVGCLVRLICSTTGTDMMAHAYIPVLSNPGLRMKRQMLLIIAVFMGKFFPSTVSQISCGISSYVVYNPDVISKEPVCNRGSAWLS